MLSGPRRFSGQIEGGAKMTDLNVLKKQFENCPCGMKHELNVRAVEIGSGITARTGEILKNNGFGKKLLLAADENTLRAASGIKKALCGFKVTERIYGSLREATLSEARAIGDELKNFDGVISVGTGSLHDICRMGAAIAGKPLCLFATAPSMDGFASYNAPLTDGNFKITYAAKSPEVIIGDTKILAAAPAELKSAGFGDMVGKYVGLIDWQVSHLITGEYYCQRVADLTRRAADKIMSVADRITLDDEQSAGEVFEALLLTGFGMSFTKTSRPASGTEHILSHFWECKKLLEGKVSDFHGKKVGVATLLIMEIYEKLFLKDRVSAHPEKIDWQDVYVHYGALKDEVIKLNTPDTITDGINPRLIEENWGKIRNIIASVPGRDRIYAAMKKAGCATETSEIGISDALRDEGLKYHPYMRRRLSLLRLSYMLD